MGLTFKLSTRQSLSIKSGRPALENGGKIHLQTLESNSQTFLGCVLPHHNTPQDHLNFLKEKTLVRPEYKVAICTRYALPSLMYHLTMHTLHQEHLELDMVSQKFLKQWRGIPARGCTSAGFFSPAVLAVKPVSQVNLEGHLGAYVNSSLVADPDTREALKCAEE